MPQATGIPVNVKNDGGTMSALNVTAAKVIKAGPGKLYKISFVNAGTTSGAFTFNDCATIGAAAASNEIASFAYNQANLAGSIVTIDWPCTTGIVLSAVPGGSPQINISFG